MKPIINYKILNSTSLKIILIVMMLLGHIYQMFSNVPALFSILTRAGLPIIMLVTAESFHYTHNKYKYILRLGIASVVMAIGSIALMGIIPNSTLFLYNSAFTLFFITTIYMLCVDKVKEGKIYIALIIAIIPIITAIPAALFVNNQFIHDRICLLIPSIFTLMDGGYFMVVLGVLFYIFRKHRYIQVIILLIFASFSSPFFVSPYAPFMALAAIPILMYNGEKGHGFKYLFYTFYPLHIWILYIIATLLSKGILQ